MTIPFGDGKPTRRGKPGKGGGTHPKAHHSRIGQALANDDHDAARPHVWALMRSLRPKPEAEPDPMDMMEGMEPPEPPKAPKGPPAAPSAPPSVPSKGSLALRAILARRGK